MLSGLTRRFASRQAQRTDNHSSEHSNSKLRRVSQFCQTSYVVVGAVSMLCTALLLHSLGLADLRRECVMVNYANKNSITWDQVFTSNKDSGPAIATEAYVCIATEDYFARGCLVLTRSLVRTGTRRHILTLVTNRVTGTMRQLIERNGGVVKEVETILGSKKVWHEECFIKFRLWEQTQYKKLVYLDADEIVMKNIDDMFSRSEYAATHDVFASITCEGDILSSALFVCEPSVQTFDALMKRLKSHPNYNTDKIGDGNIFNDHYPNWERLPMSYLVSSLMFEIAKYRDPLLKVGRVLHYSGTKPYFRGWFKGSSSCSPHSGWLVPLWDALEAEAMAIADGSLSKDYSSFDAFPTIS